MMHVTIPVPVHPAELAEQRARIAAENEQRYRASVARANRAADKPEPRPGDSLYVATARGLKSHGRAGLRFNPKPAEVKVINASDEEVAAKQRAGAYVVNPWGAEQLLAHSNEPHHGLVVLAGKPGEKPDARLAELAARAESAEQARADLEAQLAEARRQLAESRKGEPRDGAPDRIGARKGDAEVDPKPAKAK